MRFPRLRATLPPRPVHPAQQEASARRGRGGRWPGALGPRRAKGQCGAVAGAMAPAIAAGLVVRTLISRRRSGRDQETHCVSPARAERFPVDRQVQAHRRPAPDPAGEKRPLGAGRALAGGFGPPAGLGSAWRCGRGDGPCHGSGAGGSDSDLPPPLRAGTGNAPCFPRPRGTLPPGPVPPTQRKASARRWRGGRWPGALGPRRAKVQRGAVAGATAPANARGDGGTSSVAPCFDLSRRAQSKETPLRAGTGNALRFPRPRATLPPGPVPPAPTEDSARPGGREAPAGGGAGAGRGLWAPGWREVSLALWQGRWPLPWQRRSSAAASGGTPKRTAFPRPARTAATKTRATRTNGRPAPDPAGEKRPPGRGKRWSGALGNPAGRCLMYRMARAMAPAGTRGEGQSPAFGSGSACGWHCFCTLPGRLQHKAGLQR
jgi:hypothetical protein